MAAVVAVPEMPETEPLDIPQGVAVCQNCDKPSRHCQTRLTARPVSSRCSATSRPDLDSPFRRKTDGKG